MRCFRRVDLVYQADIVVTDFQCAFEFGSKKPLKTRFRRFNRDAEVALAVIGLLDHPHTAFSNLAQNLETFCDNLARLEWPS